MSVLYVPAEVFEVGGPPGTVCHLSRHDFATQLAGSGFNQNLPTSLLAAVRSTWSAAVHVLTIALATQLLSCGHASLTPRSVLHKRHPYTPWVSGVLICYHSHILTHIRHVRQD